MKNKQKKTSTARKVFYWVAGIILAALLVVFGIIGFYIKRTHDFFDIISADSANVEQIPEIAETPFVVFVSGIDTYGEIERVSRSDVNMAVVINPVVDKILIVNIPRDYYVPIHGIGTKDKLTHTGILGIDTTVATVEDFLNIKVDHYIRINFDGLKTLVDLIEGLDIDSEIAFTAHTDNGCHFDQGINHVDGRCALAYARERYAYSTGDMHRNENQAQVIQLIIRKLSDPDFLLAHYLDILDATSDHLRTNISSANIDKLVNLQVYYRPEWEIERYGLIEYGSMEYGYFYPNQKLWMGQPDWNTVQVAHDKIVDLLAQTSKEEVVEETINE